MALPTPADLAAAPLSIVVFGPGFGESIVLRVADEQSTRWAVIDSARRQRKPSGSINPTMKLLADHQAVPSLAVLTHPHADHTGGFSEIVALTQPGATVGCLEPLMHAPSPYAAAADPDDKAAVARGQTHLAHQAIEDAWGRGVARWPMHCGTARYEVADWTITVISPAEDAINAAMGDFAAGARVNLNDLSAVVLIERDDVVVVLGADAEQAAWSAVSVRLHPGDLLHARGVKVPHHASTTGIHRVLIDTDNANEVRPLVATPFPTSGTLPRFDAGGGAEQLLRAAGKLHLTAMPHELVAVAGTATLTDIRAALAIETFEDDTIMTIELDEPAGSGVLVSMSRDPHETWVMLGVGHDGAVHVTRGDHALTITA
jgi:hypothetical protein